MSCFSADYFVVAVINATSVVQWHVLLTHRNLAGEHILAPCNISYSAQSRLNIFENIREEFRLQSIDQTNVCVALIVDCHGEAPAHFRCAAS